MGYAAILVVTLLSMYALTYLYHIYYGISIPMMNSVLVSDKALVNSLFNSPILKVMV